MPADIGLLAVSQASHLRIDVVFRERAAEGVEGMSPYADAPPEQWEDRPWKPCTGHCPDDPQRGVDEYEDEDVVAEVPLALEAVKRLGSELLLAGRDRRVVISHGGAR